MRLSLTKSYFIDRVDNRILVKYKIFAYDKYLHKGIGGKNECPVDHRLYFWKPRSRMVKRRKAEV
jgi:hypothetical protein